MKSRYKLTLAYDGSHYVGWQIQQNGISIQAILEQALTRVSGSQARPLGSGRTDAGVHALGQVAHVDLLWQHGPQELMRALNSLLPEDIVVRQVESVSNDFHAQRQARRKWYRYVIYEAGRAQQAAPLLFQRAYAWQLTHPLMLGKMRAAAKCLIGRHDFNSFQASRASVQTTVRTLEKVKIHRATGMTIPFAGVGARSPRPGGGGPPLQSSFLLLDFIGEGFLKHMVRNMVGSLVEVGQGKQTPSGLAKVLRAKDRKKAGFCAPAHGLYLMKVDYV